MGILPEKYSQAYKSPSTYLSDWVYGWVDNVISIFIQSIAAFSCITDTLLLDVL